MRRRVLALCLLAYPRSRRDRDGDYLRDLALELAERHGVRREIGSLLRNGIVERVRFNGTTAWQRHGVIAALVAAIASTGLALGVLGWPAVDQRFEAEQLTCAATDGCAKTAAVVAAHVRDGWACRSSRDAREGLSVVWHCTFGSTP